MRDDPMDLPGVRTLGNYAAQQVAENHDLYERTTDEVERMRLEDLDLVWRTAAEHLADIRSEGDVRDAIAHLRGATDGRMLDASAFMTANALIEQLRKALGDTYVDDGEAPRGMDEAVSFLANSLSDKEKEVARRHLETTSADSVMERLSIGMGVRNRLRSGGFTEVALGIDNLDEIWEELLARALSR